MTHRIIRPAKTTVTTVHHLVFPFLDDPSSGYSFSCDKYGIVDENSLNPVALANYRACETGHVNGHRVVCSYSYDEDIVTTKPAVLRCDCGNKVELADWWASECSACGREYNGGGQLLAPRSQWESQY